MWRHMEKLPQRPAIIDSLQWCTQLGTFTNKGRPINISHADQAGDSQRGRERMSRGGRGWENQEGKPIPRVLFSCLSLVLSIYYHTITSTRKSCTLSTPTFDSHGSLITVINGSSPLGWSDCPLPAQLTLPTDAPWFFHHWHTKTHIWAGEVIHGTLTKGGVNELCLTSSVPNHGAAVIYCCCPRLTLPLAHTALCLFTLAALIWLKVCKK